MTGQKNEEELLRMEDEEGPRFDRGPGEIILPP